MAIDSNQSLNYGESRPFYSQVDAGTGYTLTIPNIGASDAPTWELYLGDPDDGALVGSGNADVVVNNGTQKPEVGVWIDSRGGSGTGITVAITKDQYTLVIDFTAQGVKSGSNEVKPRHYSRRITIDVE